MTTAGMFVYRCVMFYKIAKKINYCGQRPDSSIFTGLIAFSRRRKKSQIHSFQMTSSQLKISINGKHLPGHPSLLARRKKREGHFAQKACMLARTLILQRE
jgi:hypothetical protein